MTSILAPDLALIVALIAHQVFIIGFLLWTRRQGDRRSSGVAVFLALNAAADLTVVAETLAPAPWWFALRIALLFGFGPALFTYAHAMTASPIVPDQRRRLAALSVAFAVLAVLCLLPFLRIDFPDQGPVRVSISAWIGVLTALSLFSIVGGVYLWAILRLLHAHQVRLKALFSNIENQTLSWLRWVLLLLAAAWLIDLADTVGAALLRRQFLSDMAAVLIEAAWIYPLTALVLRQDALRLSSPDPAPESAAPRYEKSALDEQRMARIARKLDLTMSEEKLHRNPGLSLRDIQTRTGVSRGHLSQTLNTHVGRSFYDYVNGWRILDACQLLETSALSVTEIALEVGFQSRSTFNAAFLKARGVSPTFYRNQARGRSRTL